MILYFLEYSDSTGKALQIEAVCSNKKSAFDLLHSWYDSEMAIYEKSLEIEGAIEIDEQNPEKSIARLACKELNQWKEMEIRCRESDEWIWLKPKAVESEETICFE